MIVRPLNAKLWSKGEGFDGQMLLKMLTVLSTKMIMDIFSFTMSLLELLYEVLFSQYY